MARSLGLRERAGRSLSVVEREEAGDGARDGAGDGAGASIAEASAASSCSCGD